MSSIKVLFPSWAGSSVTQREVFWGQTGTFLLLICETWPHAGGLLYFQQSDKELTLFLS